jgi:hypothetical protein
MSTKQAEGARVERKQGASVHLAAAVCHLWFLHSGRGGQRQSELATSKGIRAVTRQRRSSGLDIVTAMGVQVPGFQRNQPQYAYAVGSMALVLLLLAMDIAHRSYKYGSALLRRFPSHRLLRI